MLIMRAERVGDSHVCFLDGDTVLAPCRAEPHLCTLKHISEQLYNVFFCSVTKVRVFGNDEVVRQQVNSFST